MSDRQVIVDKETKAKSSTSFWITMMVLMPVLYALSIGPAAWLVMRNPNLNSPFATFYAPLIWLALRTETDDLLENYARFWMGA